MHNNDLDRASGIISSCVMEAANHMQKKNVKSRTHDTKSNQPKWWDNELAELKQYKYKCLHKFHKSNKTVDLETYLQSKRCFKNTCSAKKKEHDNKLICESLLIQSRAKVSLLIFK